MLKVLDTPKKKLAFYASCIAYSSVGMMALIFGSILPDLIEEAGLNYALAGGLVSFLALGQVLGMYFIPKLMHVFGSRRAVCTLTLLIPLCLMLFTTLPPIAIMYLLIVLLGFARGVVSITNSEISNAVSGNSTACINFANACFAFGAVLAPVVMNVCGFLGFNWRGALYVIAACSFLGAMMFRLVDFSYIHALEKEALAKEKEQKQVTKKDEDSGTSCGFMSETERGKEREKEKEKEKRRESSKKNSHAYRRTLWFWLAVAICFCYSAIENSVNGWFTEYLKSTGIMTEQISRYMVSLTWVMILLGRLFLSVIPERVSKKKLLLMDAVFGVFSLIIVMQAKSIVLVLPALMCMGFFMAGVFPTTIAWVGGQLKGEQSGLSEYMAIATVGGILGPQLIGFMADAVGIQAAMGIMLLFGAVWFFGTLLLWKSKT